MYKKYCDISFSTIEYLKDILKEARWKDVIGNGRNYRTWFCSVTLLEFQNYTRAFFLLLPPNGIVHRHRDASSASRSYHIPVCTNLACFNRIYLNDQIICCHLFVGECYEIDRTIEHSSVNKGDTDRVHLIVEV